MYKTIASKPKMSWLLNYELRASMRYRRNLSLVVFYCCNESKGKWNEIFRDCIRESDVAYDEDGVTVLVMGETDKEGACHAINRFQEYFEDFLDMRYGLSSFPHDGKSGADLLDKAHNRLLRARSLEWGACVADG